MRVFNKRKFALSYKSILRLLISVGALLLVYKTVSFDAVLGVLSRVSIRTVVLLLALYVIGQVVSSYKWYLLSRHLGSKDGYLKHLYAYFIGMFANTSGLGTFGGDATRALLLSGAAVKKSDSLLSVIADRVHGLLILMIIGAVSALLAPQIPYQPLSRYLASAFLASLVLLLWLVVFVMRRLPNGSRIKVRMNTVVRSVRVGDPKLLVRITLISVLFHSLQIVMHYLMLSSLHAQIPLLYLFAVVPVINLFSSLPFSINGLGVRDASYLMLLAPAGISVQSTAACGTIWFATVSMAGFIGGLFLLISPRPSLMVSRPSFFTTA